MFFRKTLQNSALFLLMGSVQTMAESFQEWEKEWDAPPFEGVSPIAPEDMFRGFEREETPGAEEEDSTPSATIEVTTKPKEMKGPSKTLSMIRFEPGKGIKDETATTGDNATNKRLPPSLQRRQEISSPLVHEIHHEVIESYFPINSLHREAD